MRTYKVNKIEHTVFESTDEVPDSIDYKYNWKEGAIEDWVLSDDGCIIQILREGSMIKPYGKNRNQRYIGTCTGTFIVSDKTKMDTSKRLNIYSPKLLNVSKKVLTSKAVFLKTNQVNYSLIDKVGILKNINSIAMSSEKDETKLKALFKLADIMDMEDKNKTQVTQLTGAVFQGFSQDKITEAERPKELK